MQKLKYMVFKTKKGFFKMGGEPVQPWPIQPWTFNKLASTSGKISLLRIHEVGSKYGHHSDQLDADVIVILDTRPNMAFGFKLRDNDNKLVSQGMLQLLIEAYRNNWTVDICYKEYTTPKGGTKTKKTNEIYRIWLKK